MEIWIIRDGEKTGPLHDFEIRRQIEAGQLASTTPAWHEGQAEWQPLGEIDLFKREFELAAARPADPGDQRPQPPPLPQPTRYSRRFWARWLDLSLYSGLWWLGMWGASQNIEATLANPWIIFLRYIPWFVFETLLLQHFGTTPGKWLLGLSVSNLDGSRLNLAAATRRSGRVLFTGIGFGWSWLTIFCQALSLFTAEKLGNTVWDHVGGHRINFTPPSPFRLASFICLFFVAFGLHGFVFFPFAMKSAAEQNPQLKELLEKHPSWLPPAPAPDA
jgi:uncharacterized RDD family membrane protein YckC